MFLHVFFFCRVDSNTTDFMFNQPKFIVFYEMLLKVFLLFCFNRNADKPGVNDAKRYNGNCEGYVWMSQSYMPHGKYPVGNVLLSFAVLMAGASISKILLVFRHMGLCVYSARTFFAHQHTFLFPTVIHHWESYQADLIHTLKNMKDVVWSGDGRFDSMGHSAKYGTYTMLCTTIMKVVHFELVQV